MRLKKLLVNILFVVVNVVQVQVVLYHYHLQHQVEKFKGQVRINKKRGIKKLKSVRNRI
jgi:hypothetical protein